MDTYMDTYTHAYKDIVELLLLAGANPWHRVCVFTYHHKWMDTYMDTYTHTYKDIVELLLLAGANPWHIDKENMTAFEGTNFSKQKLNQTFLKLHIDEENMTDLKAHILKSPL
jgi:hypothetical protein